MPRTAVERAWLARWQFRGVGEDVDLVARTAVATRIAVSGVARLP